MSLIPDGVPVVDLSPAEKEDVPTNRFIIAFEGYIVLPADTNIENVSDRGQAFVENSLFDNGNIEAALLAPLPTDPFIETTGEEV